MLNISDYVGRNVVLSHVDGTVGIDLYGQLTVTKEAKYTVTAKGAQAMFNASDVKDVYTSAHTVCVVV